MSQFITPAGSRFGFPEDGAAMNYLELDYFMIIVNIALLQFVMSCRFVHSTRF